MIYYYDGRGIGMWMSVDRVEGSVVVLIADDEQVYRLDTSAYEVLTGIPPTETHMLWCEARDGLVISARFDPTETERRLSAASARLKRLINSKHS